MKQFEEQDHDSDFQSPLSSPSKSLSSKPVVKPFQLNTKVVENRVIAHIDLDCFYVQVERFHDPSLKGKPVAVVQYNPFGDLKSYAPSDNRFKENGSIIAVSYEARAVGVKRIMRGGEAKKVCPEMILVQVPTSHGKADLTIYREASAKILKVLGLRYTSVTIERASIDEVYLDVTAEATKLLRSHDSVTFLKTYIDFVRNAPTVIAGADSKEIKMTKADIRNGYAGQGVEKPIVSEESTHTISNDSNEITTITNESSSNNLINSGNNVDNTTVSSNNMIVLPETVDISWFDRPVNQWTMEDRMLLAGSVIIQQLRQDVWDHLGFTCSAGIAINKMLAKLASGMHKPNKQTLVPTSAINNIIDNLPFSRVQGFGGKLGYEINNIFGENVQTMSHLLSIPRELLLKHFGPETTQWIIQRAQGVDYDLVQDRSLPVSIGCSKSFRSSNILLPQHLQDGTVLFWLQELANELCERILVDMETNQRRPKNLHVGFSVYFYTPKSKNNSSNNTNMDVVAQWWQEAGISLSKTAKLPLQCLPSMNGTAEHNNYNNNDANTGSTSSNNNSSCVSAGLAMAKMALSLVIKAINENQRVQQEKAQHQGSKSWGITSMGLSVTNFDKIETGKKSIFSYLKPKAECEDVASSLSSSSRINTSISSYDDGSIVPSSSKEKNGINSSSNNLMAWMNKTRLSSTQLSLNSAEYTMNNAASAVKEIAQEREKEEIEFLLSEIEEKDATIDLNKATMCENSRDKDGWNQEKLDDEEVIALLDDDDTDDVMLANDKNFVLIEPTSGVESQQHWNALKITHQKYLRHIEWGTFVTLPEELQRELVNEAMFHQSSSSNHNKKGSSTNKRLSSWFLPSFEQQPQESEYFHAQKKRIITKEKNVTTTSNLKSFFPERK